MKNVLIISTTEEELLSNVDDGTNRLFINGSEIPSTDWMGTGNYTATVEGHAITIAKIDVESLDGLNVSLAKTADYTYEMRRRVPTTIVVDDELSTSSINPVQNKVITNALNGKVAKTDIDNALSTTSENPVQNKVITGALNGKVAKSDVDTAMSSTSEDPVQNKVIKAALDDKYDKTGGWIKSTADNTPVVIQGNSASETWIRFNKSNDSSMGYIGVKSDNKPYFYNNAEHEIALKDEVLPLTGGTISNGTNDTALYTKGTATGAYIGYEKNDNSMLGYIGVKSDNKPYFYDNKNHRIALEEDIITYDLGTLSVSGQNITQYFLDFVAAHKEESNIEGRFMITSTNVPPDIPDSSSAWRYSFGRFIVRYTNANGVSDGLIELYEWGTTRIARKSVKDNTFGSWSINDEALNRFGGLKGVIAIAQTSSSTPNVNVPVVVWTTYLAISTYSGTIGMWLILCANGSISVSPIIANTKVTFTYVNSTTLRVSCSQRANVTIIDCGKS